MGKFGHFGIRMGSDGSGADNNAPLSKHATGAHAAYSAGALHVPPRSAVPSPKPSRYSDESEDYDKQMQIPAVVSSRLQVQSISSAVSSPTPPVPTAPLAPAHSGDGGQTQYSRLASRMINMVNELRATGADVALELPTIVVCGQQSAGKSSVVEAICGIPLPRNQETCTRCPTEVRLSQQPPMSGASWEAVVKLRRESGQGASVSQSQAWHTEQSRPQQPHSGGRSPSEVALNVDETPGADTLSLETVFRTSISSQSDLPVAVSAAQSALLAQSRYSSGGGSDRRNTGPSSVGRVAAGVMAAAEATTDSSVPLKFSKDVVVVEVRGAPADLTLIDLPGIIHSVERPEDEHYKQLVADLANSYMRRPGVVIVATVTCKEDIDTQVILSMARDADPRGERTLGVLTKPDQVEEGCHGQWLQVLAGERYALALGWYVVRNPSQAALVRGTSGILARQQEEAFFGSTPPWNRLALASKSRLGTLKLREAMSKQLVKMVTAARPGLMAAAQAQLVTLRAELASMPPAVLGDAHAEMLRLIDDVSMTLQEEVLARSQSKQFYQHLLTNFQQLKQDLTASRPCFLLPRNTANGASSGSIFWAVTCALDDDLTGPDELRQQQMLTGGSFTGRNNRDDPQNPGAPGLTLTVNAKMGPGSFDIFSNNSNKDGSNTGAKPGLAVFAGGNNTIAQSGAMIVAPSPYQVLLPTDSYEAQQGMTLENVRQLVDRHHSIELPGFSPYSAVQDLITRHQQGWGRAVSECAGQAHRQLLHLVMAHVAKTFDRFPRAADHIRELATELLEELHTSTTAAVDSLVAMEMSGAFAVARREFSRASSQHLEGLRTLLATAGNSSTFASGLSTDAANNPPPDNHTVANTGSNNSSRRNIAADQQLNAGAMPALPQTAGLYDPGVILSPIPATATGPAELLSMMSVVLTYYGISVRRLTDTVSMSIMHHLINSFNKQFRSKLASKLLSLTSDAVGSLLVEDAQSAARRAALKAQKDMLEQALKVMRAAA